MPQSLVRRRIVLAAALGLVALCAVWGARSVLQGRSEQEFRQGLAALREGDLARVADAIAALEEDRRFASQARLLRGGQRAARGDHVGALYEFSAVQAVGDLRLDVLLLAGESLYRLGRSVEAETAFRQAATQFPTSAEARRWLAALYHDRGAMEAARSELEVLATLEPDDYLVHRRLGLLYLRDLANVGRAIECYRLALGRNPPPNEADQIAVELAEALMSRREYSEALDVLQQRKFHDARSLAMRAECLWSINQRDAALRDLRQARELDPDERAALVFQARVHQDEGDAEAAIAPLQRVLELDPHDFSARYRLVRAYQQMGQTGQALEELARMKESEKLRTDLTRLYVEALDRPTDAAIREQIAGLCDRLGQSELAARWRQAAEACRSAAQFQMSVGAN